MKARNLALMLALTAAPGIAWAQRTLHSEEKTTSATTRSNSLATERKTSASVHSNAQVARFNKVIVALNLNNHQKKSVATLIQSTRDQLAAIRADSSLTPAQQQQAAQAIGLGLAQKFVGLLTPAQKTELAALLLKREQQKANSSSANSSASPSAPNIPSIDAPSPSDSDSSQDSSSSTNASKDSTPADSTTAAANSSTISNAGVTQPANAEAEASSSAVAAAKPGHLSDAQLAAILNSFVRDESDDSGAKAGSQPGVRSSS